MKKQLMILFILLTAGLVANAQKEYRLARTTGLLKLNLKNAVIEGYDGKEIIFSGQGIEPAEVDERAKGLVAVSSSGYSDNTGLGISVSESGGEINVSAVSKTPIGVVTIKVPQQIKISFVNNNNSYAFTTTGGSVADELVLKNLKNEIEVSTYSHKIKLENNTGPMNIKTVRGSIEGVFNNDIKGPISIISVYDYVDVTLPASTKANLELGSSYGKIYVGKEFKIDFDKVEADKKQAWINGDNITITNAPFTYVTTTTTNTNRDRGDGQSSSTAGGVGGSINNKNKATAQSSTTTSGATGSTGAQSRTKTLDGSGTQTLLNGDFTYTTSLFSGGEKIKGKVNGGGIDIILKSSYKSIYLRQ
jgi:hypothetical protein